MTVHDGISLIMYNSCTNFGEYAGITVSLGNLCLLNNCFITLWLSDAFWHLASLNWKWIDLNTLCLRLCMHVLFTVTYLFWNHFKIIQSRYLVPKVTLYGKHTMGQMYVIVYLQSIIPTWFCHNQQDRPLTVCYILLWIEDFEPRIGSTCQVQWGSIVEQ